MATKYLNFRYADGHVHLLRNTNQTMRDNWFCNGMKTGYTDKAKHCLVSSGSANGREAICIILGSGKESVFSDSAKMLRWALGLPQTAQTAVCPYPSTETKPVPQKHHRHHKHHPKTQNT